MSPLDRFTCEQVFERLDDYLDRELSPPELELVRVHLESCAVCAAEHDFEAQVIDQLRAKLRRIEVPAAVVARVQAALRAWPPPDPV